MLTRLLRILRHRWLDERDSHRTIGPAALERLEAQVQASERAHSGEIRVCVEAGLPLSYLWRDASARERAVAMFGKLRIWDTAQNNGVLIYLLLAEHQIEVVADRGLAAHVDEARWREIVGGMAASFRAGAYEAGLQAAIAAVDQLLRSHFPLDRGVDNLNELPDHIDLR